ncbi:MAG: hypothetical protein ABIY70_21205 [Capsulimonas sp.]|uniref:hypothetical protein n=1 Tax=Capsulimonas sp. TaxID=2494211 RepID=UPI003262E0AB
MSTELTDALGAPQPLTLGGKTYMVEPINLNDLVLIEQRQGDVDNIQATSIEELKFLLWIFMRKADLSLTTEKRDLCDYQMTEDQAGKMVTLKMFADGSVAKFVRECLIISGLISEGPAKKTPAKKQPAAGRTSASSPS